MKVKVFAYGTLMDGYGNSLKDAAERNGFHAEYLGNDVIAGTMYSLGGYPCVKLFGFDTSEVHGEVYETDREGLAWMDRLEGYRGVGQSNYYDRTIIETKYGDAWIYHIENEHYHRIPVESGSWAVHTGALQLEGLSEIGD